MGFNIRNRISLYKNNLNNNLLFKKMIYNELKKITSDKIKMFEIGTAYGDSSTIAIWKQLKKNQKGFSLFCFEPVEEIFEVAQRNIKHLTNTYVLQKYFLSTESVNFFLMRASKYIHDTKNLEGIKNVYKGINPNELITIDNLEIPNIVFIDSIRYSHFAIVKTLNEFNKNIRVIMEDDIPSFGELKIIQEEFNIKNVKYYRCFPHQWPFVAFNLISKG